MDSGATSHVCSDLTLFREVFQTSGMTVSLPNGTRIPIMHTGTIALSEHLILYDVLYVHSFHFNLVSVSSLLRDSKCSAHFFPTSFYIQEPSQGLMIGKGDMLLNLYILDIAKPIVCAAFLGSLSSDGALWHTRLGHPSLAKLQLISEVLSIPKASLSSDRHCPVCPLAKQKH